jgi:type II secretory pathway pseudopilin PulG
MSLIEVLAAVIVLGVLLVVAAPQLSMPGTVNASTVAQQIAADLFLARQLAIAYRVNYTLEFSPSTAPYTTYTVRNDATGIEEPDFPKTIPSEVTASGGQRAITFTPDGCVDDDGLGTLCAGTDRSVTVAGGGATATVQVYWYAGRVKVVGP